jgi:hypothetical protein
MVSRDRASLCEKLSFNVTEVEGRPASRSGTRPRWQSPYLNPQIVLYSNKGSAFLFSYINEYMPTEKILLGMSDFVISVRIIR